MSKRTLTILTCRWTIYVGIFVFFAACCLGYVSHVSVDVVVKKAIIAGSFLGVVFFFSMRCLVNLIPDETHAVQEKNIGSVTDSQDQTVEVSS
ncbi:MAG: hypothetical protein MRK01_12170 [Candidatus Scalindua sp.]|nr:hypothetical protein [Candidatus Scalindua sp.]